jgi:hypothetical protein
MTSPVLGAEIVPPLRPHPTTGFPEITSTRCPWIPRSQGRFLPGRELATEDGDTCDPSPDPPACPQAIAPSCFSIARDVLRWWATAPRLKFHRPSHSGGQYNQLYPKCRDGSSSGRGSPCGTPDTILCIMQRQSGRKATTTMSAGKQKKKPVEICIHCGHLAEVTREHVIPRNLFPKPRPQTMVTVGVCQPCNGGKSLDDSYLRDFLLSDIATRRNPAAEELRKTTFKTSLERNSSELARTVVKTARRKPFFSPGGIYLGSPYSVALETDRLENYFKKVVLGLYFHVHKTRLAEDALIEVSRINGHRGQATWDEMARSGAALSWIKKDVFVCQYIADATNPLYSRWLLLFYNTIIIEILTMPSNWMDLIATDEEADPASGLILPDSESSKEAGAP